MTYSEKLKHPKWQRKRLEIMQRDGFKCKLCQDDETTLHVHHLSYSKEPWDTDQHDLVTLCENCHTQVESVKKENPDFIYDELDLIKIPYEDKNYLYFIRYQDEITLRYIDNKRTGGFDLSHDTISNLNKLKNKAVKFIKDHEL